MALIVTYCFMGDHSNKTIHLLNSRIVYLMNTLGARDFLARFPVSVKSIQGYPGYFMKGREVEKSTKPGCHIFFQFISLLRSGFEPEVQGLRKEGGRG